MSRLIISLSVLLCTVLAIPARAELPPDFQKLENTYKQQIEKVNKEDTTEAAGLSSKHIENLRLLEGRLQKAGQLEPLLAVRKERERFEKDPKITEETLSTDIPELRTIQVQYMESVSGLPLKRAGKVVAVVQSYDKALKALQERLTRGGDVDSAVLVKEQRDALQQRPEVTAARFIVEEADAKKAKEKPAAETVDAQAPQKPAEAAAKQPAGTKKQAVTQTEPKFKGSPERYIKNRFEEFFKTMQDQDFRKASEYIEPELVKRRGMDMTSARLRMYYAAMTGGGNPRVKIEPDDVELDKENGKATLSLRARVDNRIFEAPPVHWMEVDGDWFISIEQGPGDQPRPAMQQWR